jgi:hypothetical protein
MHGLFASVVIGSIGLGLFLYGRKQRRVPHAAVGIALMGFPYLVASPWWIWSIGAGLLAALYLASYLGL